MNSQEKKEQHYKVLRNISTKNGEVRADDPNGRNIIKTSDLDPKDIEILLDHGGYLEPYPKLIEDMKKPIPEVKFHTTDPAGKEFEFETYTDEELELPANIGKGNKILKELLDDVVAGIESYEKVDRMLAKTQLMKDGKLKTHFLSKLNQIMRTKKKNQ